MTKYKLNNDTLNQSPITLTSYLVGQDNSDKENAENMKNSEGDAVTNGGLPKERKISLQIPANCKCSEKCKFSYLPRTKTIYSNPFIF